MQQPLFFFGAKEDLNKAAHSAVSDQPSGLLLSPRFPTRRNVYRETDCPLSFYIYNDPQGYADLILNGDPEEYLKNVAGSHGLED